MDFKKTNKELIEKLKGIAGLLLKYERGESKVRPTAPESVKKEFDLLIEEAYYIAFLNGRLGDLLDDIALMLKNKNPEGVWKEELEMIQKRLEDKQLHHLEQLKNMPSKDRH
jgi:hypothetical protein|tara:strand:- start:6478 stop:6813 length:336 start_codon:yes stop_codon:yes gene_type:complete